MEFDGLRFWLDVVWKVGTILGLIYLGYKQQRTATETEIEQLDERVDGHEGRLIRVEEAQKAAPSHHDLQSIHDRISKSNELAHNLQAEVAGLRNDMRTVLRQLELLHRHHYGEGRE